MLSFVSFCLYAAAIMILRRLWFAPKSQSIKDYTIVVKDGDEVVGDFLLMRPREKKALSVFAIKDDEKIELTDQCYFDSFNRGLVFSGFSFGNFKTLLSKTKTGWVQVAIRSKRNREVWTEFKVKVRSGEPSQLLIRIEA